VACRDGITEGYVCPVLFLAGRAARKSRRIGGNGEVPLDLDDNRFLVPDVEALPPKEQELFLRYAYW
jgi:hypothetical protein